ncbi:prolipoprotein diacylglyceryl transferase [Melissococcus plutonius ATCC 35311]|uniref:Phosphatidylglycerol--prolipoprotein diacylglyceryl transferase n=1 Tax=Melissococcus plutonius (strain ATCC 35311 / DSM 29964 / CIP 104052 / LMG 20360 / NCIMB 702443) TaxID=940190 RepID=F3YA63_MELPT|nr:prolipoprotein diacylglyceryl transferase [Melissococcus plutonius]KMT40704.1 prolipoprotein diacylglyceryl transferase Lgt [Melissococcus plutonius]MBB5176845.1 phosphatidylglycerol:prolipoprotein diacylglycerol transferase [Melissococcus plutonius]BAK21391.1 prolipoprotein diacylglyceryl transferase [Melissococcus plutonius ATCC 35311]
MILQLNPVAFRLFGISIYWYAVIIVSGIFIGVWLSSREAVRVGLKSDDVIDFMLWGLPSAIIGARLYYVAFKWQDYINNPLEIFLTRNGGLAIYGGLIGGGIALLIFTYQRFISPWTFLDIAAPSVLLAQAIGRWGNFMNHEAYGPKTTHAFLSNLHLPNFIITNMKMDGFYRQPTFLYESCWSLLGFCLLILLRRKKHFFKQGEVFLSYIGWYAFGRFFIEGMRTDSLYLFNNIRISQVLSFIIFISVLIIIYVRRKTKNLNDYERIQNNIV